MSETKSTYLERPTRIVAGVLGVMLVATGVLAVVMMARALMGGSGEDGRWHAGGLAALPCGLLMIQAARTGRDPLQALISAGISSRRAGRR